MLAAGVRAELVRQPRGLAKMMEARLVVGNRAAETIERAQQDFDAIEVDEHVVEHAVQLASHPVDGSIRAHFQSQLHKPDPYRNKRLGPLSFPLHRRECGVSAYGT